MVDVIVVGAGPAGSYTAKFLAEKGFRVTLAEEHNKIGRPVQCTGLLSHDALNIDLIKDNLDKFLKNKLTTTRVFAPDGNFAQIPLKGDLVVDRFEFDSFLSRSANSSGVKVLKNHRFMSFKKGQLLFQGRSEIHKLSADIIIGADGPLTRVGRESGLVSISKNPKKFMFGIQKVVRFKSKKFENCIDFFPYLGRFSWIVPVNSKVARVGVAEYLGRDSFSMRDKLNSLLYAHLQRTGFFKIITEQAGLIPVYNPKQKVQTAFHGNKVFLVGDAATQVKATTGGGIVPGLRAAECLVHSICKNKDYTSELKKKLTSDLDISLRIRNALDKFSDKDYCDIVQLCKQSKVQRVFKSTSRDSPKKLFLQLVAAEPRFLKFGRFLF